MKSIAKLKVIFLLVPGLVAVTIGLGTSAYEKVNSAESHAMAAWFKVEAHLVWRYQLVPVLEQVLDRLAVDDPAVGQVARAQGDLGRARGVTDRIEAYKVLEERLGVLFGALDKYPQLEGDFQYTDLRDKLERNLRSLEADRAGYNRAAAAFNESLKAFPGSVIARAAGLRPLEPMPSLRAE